MPGRNSGICHGCRAKDHYFADCKRKRRCIRCPHGYEKCFVVEKENKNKGKLFLCCSNNCGFWEWVVKEESSGPFRRSSANVTDHVKNDIVEQLSRTFEKRVRISDKEDLKISVDVSIRAEKVSYGWDLNAKGEGAS